MNGNTDSTPYSTAKPTLADPAVEASEVATAIEPEVQAAAKQPLPFEYQDLSHIDWQEQAKEATAAMIWTQQRRAQGFLPN